MSTHPVGWRTIRSWSLVLTSTLVLRPSLTAARPSATSAVQLRFEACTPEVVREVSRLLEIEITSSRHATPRRLRRTVVEIRCTGPEVSLYATDEGVGQQMERHIAVPATDLRSTPRLLALTLAEMLAAIWARPRTHPPRARADTSPGTTVGPATGAPPTPVAIAIAGSSLRFLGQGLQLYGARLRVTRRFADSPVGLIFGGSFERGRSRMNLGRIDADLVAGTLGLSIGFDGAAVAFEAWLAADVGRARVSGRPYDRDAVLGGEVGGLWWSPILGSSLSWRPFSSVFFVGAVEGGWPTSSVVGVSVIDNTNPEQVGFRGVWLRVFVGVGFTCCHLPKGGPAEEP